jgi:hypothetical protein
LIIQLFVVVAELRGIPIMLPFQACGPTTRKWSLLMNQLFFVVIAELRGIPIRLPF